MKEKYLNITYSEKKFGVLASFRSNGTTITVSGISESQARKKIIPIIDRLEQIEEAFKSG